MRTLKKTLCLVLALAMMVGLCAVGASAITIDDYKDKDTIKNVEAVKVLTAMGVLQGDDQGNFRATDALNRAEGATFFTKLSAQTGAGIPSFTDIGNYSWANGAIAYCEQNGIINGYGDGTFGPGDPLSEVAFAKMCLCALGYDAQREGLVGPQWEINTIKLVNALNLADGIATLNWNGPISRDNSAQFAFNTLKAKMVEYKGGTDITVNTGDTNVAVKDNIKATPIENKSYDYRGAIGSEYADKDMQFIENFFPTVKLAHIGDRFKNPTNNWFNANNRNDNTWSVTKQFAVEETNGTMATYTTPATVALSTVYTDSGLGAPKALTVFENGDEVYTTTLDVRPTNTGKMTKYAGATVKLIDSTGDGAANYATVKYAYAAKVNKVLEAKKNDGVRALQLSIYNYTDGKTTSTATVPSDSFAKNDIVLVYPAGAIDQTKNTNGLSILEIAAPETVKGTLSKVTTGRSYTVDGVAYPFAADTLANMGLDGATVKGSTPTLNKTYTLYLSNGNVIGLAGEAPTYTEYVFAVNSAADTTTDVTRPESTKTVYKVGVVKQDGSTQTLTAELSGKIDMAWYTATTSNGLTTFDKFSGEVDAEMKEGTKLQKDTPTIKSTNPDYNLVTDANTVFVFYTATGYKVYNGLSNLPSYTIKGTDTVKAYGLVVNGIAKAVFIDMSKQTASGTTAETIYILGSNVVSKSVDANNKTIYTYPAIVDGAIGTVDTTIATIGTTKNPIGLVIPTRNDAGYVTATASAGISSFAVDTSNGINASGWTLIVNGTAYATTADTQIFYYDASKPADNIDGGTPTDLIGLTGTMTLVPVSDKDATLKAVYLVK